MGDSSCSPPRPPPVDWLRLALPLLREVVGAVVCVGHHPSPSPHALQDTPPHGKPGNDRLAQGAPGGEPGIRAWGVRGWRRLLGHPPGGPLWGRGDPRGRHSRGEGRLGSASWCCSVRPPRGELGRRAHGTGWACSYLPPERPWLRGWPRTAALESREAVCCPTAVPQPFGTAAPWGGGHTARCVASRPGMGTEVPGSGQHSPRKCQVPFQWPRPLSSDVMLLGFTVTYKRTGYFSLCPRLG